MNHVRFMISPELNVVQDKLKAFSLHPVWRRASPLYICIPLNKEYKKLFNIFNKL
jgi:hypothetical protein